MLCFELMSGTTPFEADDVQEIYKNILAGAEKFTMEDHWQHLAQHLGECSGTEKAKTQNAWNLFKTCCRRDPHERLPMWPGGNGNLIWHDFFADFEWAQLEMLEMAPPYCPVVRSPSDMANFNCNPSDLPSSMPYQDPGNGWDEDF